MRNEFDYVHERPSRLSRAVVLLSTVGVALIAAWVFIPILLANYAAHTATSAAKPVSPEAVREPATASVSVVRSAAAATAPVAAASGTTTALASPADDAAPPPRVSAAPSAPSFGARALIPWPGDQPLAETARLPAASAAPADTPSTRFAAISATTDPVDPADKVPLPRRRPNRTIAAHLAIPLPRPRPDIVSENTPPSRPTTFDLQVDRMR